MSAETSEKITVALLRSYKRLQCGTCGLLKKGDMFQARAPQVCERETRIAGHSVAQAARFGLLNRVEEDCEHAGPRGH